jgi:hypothetical protein
MTQTIDFADRRPAVINAVGGMLCIPATDSVCDEQWS